MSPSSRTSSVACAALTALASSCAPRPAELATAEALPSAPRRADGVALDLVSAPLPAHDRASSARGFAALRAPLDVDAALHVVDEFFEHAVSNDAAGVIARLTSDAVASSTGPAGERQPVLSRWWEQRLKRLDYTQAAGAVLYRGGDVRVLPTDSPSETVAVRVRVAEARAGHTRLFGDELTFWLRRDGSQPRIFRIEEDFQLP